MLTMVMFLLEMSSFILQLIDDRNVFVCPYCQECSLQQFYSKEGCPKIYKTKSTNLFPYLNVTGLADEHVIDLEKRLISDR